MQKLLLVATVVSLISACSSKEVDSVEALVADGNMEDIRAKRKELSSRQKQLEKEISLLDSAIDSKKENTNLPLVTAFEAHANEFYHYVELQGDVTTKQNVLIYPEASGLLVDVRVEEGERVKKGQLLGIIDDGGLRSQLIQMEAQLALAKTTFERQKRLWDQKVGSEIQFLEAKTNYESQKNAVDQMRSQLDKFRVKAPFSGIIDDVIKEQGTVVSPGPGSEIFRIINLTDMYLEVLVPETYLTSVVPGKRVKVHFPILNDTIDTKVKETGNFINPNNRSFNVRVPVPNKEGKIKPNLTAKVLINDYYQEEAILIPQSVISENAEGDQYVYAVAEDDKGQTATVKRRIIETGKTQNGKVEITSGISDGTRIILEGARSVKDGQLVKILKN
ncbi:efflux RND transporter periplasmic adaptor subunit [Fulvivirga sp. RKSG066]|uniref:efflux RND transporter periplasmic adaptor subunit n=1 Tax=Fulvivirga aurantia TaxID=2529383 RepID=UPI0012BBB5BE|nr:efflux RND transporter periplasmic adaptor subunit [Fulvivirga aurantia]MTI22844.1 efflux RND transporter periplasmic adaptor subunit [Fulvivirga aurantia]